MTRKHSLRPEIPADPRRSISLSESERSALRGGPDGGSAPAPGPAPDSLMTATSAAAIGAAFLDALEPLCRHVVLLRPARGELTGWVGRGPALEERQLAALSESIQGDFGLETIVGLAGPTYLEDPTSLGVARIASCWGVSSPRVLLVVPVRVGTRQVAVAVGEPREPRAPDNELAALSAAAGKAFGRLLADRRSQAVDGT